MKNIVSAILCLSILMSSAAYASDVKQNAQSGTQTETAKTEVSVKDEKIRYVALGDSISTGFGLTIFTKDHPDNPKSPNLFVNRLSASLDLPVLNLAKDGIDTTDLLNLIKNLSQDKKKILGEAELITVSTGGNNLLAPLLELSKKKSDAAVAVGMFSSPQLALISMLTTSNAQEQANVRAIIDDGVKRFCGTEEKKYEDGEFMQIVNAIRAVNPNAKLVFQTIYYPYASFNIPEEVDNATKEMNRIILAKAQEGNYTVIDLYDLFRSPDFINMQRLDSHPNNAGTTMIYLLMMQALGEEIPFTVNGDIKNGSLSYIVNADLSVNINIKPDAGYGLPKEISYNNGTGDTKVSLVKDSFRIPNLQFIGNIKVSGECVK